MITLCIKTNYSRHDFQEFIEKPREFIDISRNPWMSSLSRLFPFPEKIHYLVDIVAV